jgi:uroporphyrinogen-III synthase
MAAKAALVTRPLEDAAAIAAALAARGIEAVVAPLVEIEVRRAAPPLVGVQAILATSANGVRAFCRQSGKRDLPLFAVGDASAAAARALGFATVESAGGNVEDLAALVCARLQPRDGGLLYPAGSIVAGDLAGQLSLLGFDVRRYVAYAARAVRELPPRARAAVADGLVDVVLLYSPRTAEIFRDLVGRAGLTENCRFLNVFCLSDAVARALLPLRFRDIRVAARPDQPALLALFDASGEKSG